MNQSVNTEVAATVYDKSRNLYRECNYGFIFHHSKEGIISVIGKSKYLSSKLPSVHDSISNKIIPLNDEEKVIAEQLGLVITNSTESETPKISKIIDNINVERSYVTSILEKYINMSSDSNNILIKLKCDDICSSRRNTCHELNAMIFISKEDWNYFRESIKNRNPMKLRICGRCGDSEIDLLNEVSRYEIDIISDNEKISAFRILFGNKYDPNKLGYNFLKMIKKLKKKIIKMSNHNCLP